MISCCHADVSLKCSILAAPWFTSIIWHSLFPFSNFFPLLLPIVHQLPLLLNVSSWTAPLCPHQASGSQGHQATSVPTKFTSKLTLLVLKSWTLSSGSPCQSWLFDDLLLLKLPFYLLILVRGTDIVPDPETQSTSCLNLSTLISYIQAGCRHQPWKFSLQKGL